MCVYGTQYIRENCLLTIHYYRSTVYTDTYNISISIPTFILYGMYNAIIVNYNYPYGRLFPKTFSKTELNFILSLKSSQKFTKCIHIFKYLQIIIYQ